MRDRWDRAPIEDPDTRSPKISARDGLIGNTRPAYPNCLRKRCGRELFFFRSGEAPTSATEPGCRSALRSLLSIVTCSPSVYFDVGFMHDLRLFRLLRPDDYGERFGLLPIAMAPC
jgi:hypothetical protein